MKKYILLMIFVPLFLSGCSEDEPQKDPWDICIEKGGVPGCNWNCTRMKRCDFPPEAALTK